MGRPHRIEEIIFDNSVSWNENNIDKYCFSDNNRIKLDQLYELLEHYINPRNQNGLDAPSNREFREYAEELNPELPNSLELEFGGFITSPDSGREVVITTIVVDARETDYEIPKEVMTALAEMSPSEKEFNSDYIELMWH